jgi:uncharacterized protein YndB with AHSA1/START domain
MSGMSLRVERIVAASPAAVWGVLTDLDGAERNLTGVTKVERLGGPQYGVGTRWRETRRMFGTDATEEMEVAEVVPERSTVIDAESHGMRYRTAFTLTPRDGATLVEMTFHGEPASASWIRRVVGAITAPLGIAVSRKAMRQDLEDIAAAAERG